MSELKSKRASQSAAVKNAGGRGIRGRNKKGRGQIDFVNSKTRREKGGELTSSTLEYAFLSDFVLPPPISRRVCPRNRSADAIRKHQTD